MRKFWLTLVAVTLILSLGAPAWAGEPTDELRRATDRIIQVLDDPSLKAPEKRQEREAAVKRIAVQAFDVPEAARRALGPHWQGRTSAERTEFVQLFADLLQRAYVSKIDLYTGERVRYTGEAVDGDYAVVHARVLTRKEQEVPVDARMLKRDGHWLMYDVVIENVSLVANYRAQFDRVIRTASYADLVKRLRTQERVD